MLDKIRKIKYARMKPEEKFVYDIVTNVVEYYHKNDTNDVYYKHKDITIFNYQLISGNFWCDHYNFWSVLEYDYHLNYEEIKTLVKYMAEEHLIKKDIEPRYRERFGKENLIKKDVKPNSLFGKMKSLVDENIIKKDVPLKIFKGIVAEPSNSLIEKKNKTRN